MKVSALVFMLLFALATTARAQQPLPVVLDSQTYADLVRYLNEQPARIANPVLNLLAQLQAKAQQEASEKKDAPTQKPE